VWHSAHTGVISFDLGTTSVAIDLGTRCVCVSCVCVCVLCVSCVCVSCVCVCVLCVCALCVCVRLCALCVYLHSVCCMYYPGQESLLLLHCQYVVHGWDRL